MSTVELTIVCGIAGTVAGTALGVLIGWALKALMDRSVKSLDE